MLARSARCVYITAGTRECVYRILRMSCDQLPPPGSLLLLSSPLSWVSSAGSLLVCFLAHIPVRAGPPKSLLCIHSKASREIRLRPLPAPLCAAVHAGASSPLTGGRLSCVLPRSGYTPSSLQPTSHLHGSPHVGERRRLGLQDPRPLHPHGAPEHLAEYRIVPKPSSEARTQRVTPSPRFQCCSDEARHRLILDITGSSFSSCTIISASCFGVTVWSVAVGGSSGP